VVETNHTLKDSPQFVNEDPYGKGWIIKMEMQDKGELKELLSPKGYQDFLPKEEE
jgi:glycine cleavage system H protein